MGTVNGDGVRFRLYPQDHEPVRAHGRYGGTVAIVELREDGSVALADRADAVIPRNAKRNEVKKILEAARNHFDEIAAEWMRMHEE